MGFWRAWERSWRGQPYSYVDYEAVREAAEEGFGQGYQAAREQYDDDDYDNYDSVMLEHDSEDGRLYIQYRLVKTISDMFGLSLTEARIRIKDWFENENGLIVKFVESDKIAGKQYFNNEDEDTNN